MLASRKKRKYYRFQSLSRGVITTLFFYILILGENPMKKTLIALSVFAGLTGVAQADTTTLYGRVGYAVNIDDATEVDSKTTLNLKESNIRLGIKGDEQLNNGLEAFYQLEFDYKLSQNKLDSTGAVKKEGDRLDTIREAKVGLRGAFGQIAFGKMQTLRGAWLLKADKMVSTSGEGWNHTRLGKVINYTTPVAGGVTVGASMVLDGNDGYPSDVIQGHRRNFNAAEAGATFNMNGFDVGVVYTKAANEVLKSDLFGTNGAADEEIAASVGHSNDVYSVGFDYAHRASEGNYYALGAEYYLDPTNTFRGGVEVFDPSGSNVANPKNQYRAFLGYQYNFSKRTFAWVEAAYNRHEGGSGNATSGWKKESGYTAVVGIRHNF